MTASGFLNPCRTYSIKIESMIFILMTFHCIKQSRIVLTKLILVFLIYPVKAFQSGPVEIIHTEYLQ